MDSANKKEVSPPVDRVKIQVRMDNELHQKLSKEAKANERSLSGQVRYYVLKGLRENK